MDQTQPDKLVPGFPAPRTVDTGDLNLAVYELGDGPPVILVHGFPELAYSWRHQLPALAAAGYRAIEADRRARLGVGYVPQGREIFPLLTVEENLHMGGFFNTKSEIRKSQDHVYELFPRLKEREHQRAGTMSGGEQQMLAIGRALMSKPRMIILDEPSLGLAPIIIQQIFEIIGQLREEGITVFLVEQNAHQALSLADRGYVLETGRIRLHDTGKNLLANPEVRDAYLGG